MANTKSILKVKEYLTEKQEPVSISDICTNASLKWKSVKDCLEFLQQTNQVVIMSSAGTTLVQLKKEVIANGVASN